jgi:hypothetical protein
MEEHVMNTKSMSSPAALAVILLGCLAALAGHVASAHASGQATCTGTSEARYSPGLRNTPALVTTSFHEVLGPCLSLSDPTVRTGTMSGGVTATSGCEDLLHSSPGAVTFHWNNGNSSTFTYNSEVDLVLGQLVIVQTGAITAGEFSGSSAVTTITDVGDLTACAGSGLTSVEGPLTLNILP